MEGPSWRVAQRVGGKVGATVGVSELYCVKFVGKNVGAGEPVLASIRCGWCNHEEEYPLRPHSKRVHQENKAAEARYGDNGAFPI